MAIAFGLGGRDVAARMLEDAYRSGREQRDEVREHRSRSARRDPETQASQPRFG
jgi:hypothetical protein